MVPWQNPINTDAPPSPIDCLGVPPAGTGRPRSRSLKLLDTLLHDARSRSSSASSRYSRSPDSASIVLANIGLAAGTVGAEQVKPKRSLEEDVLEGFRVFLSGFQNIIRRAGTILDQRVETIEVNDNAQSEHSLHPITEADRNPFGTCTDADSATGAEGEPDPEQHEDAWPQGDRRMSQPQTIFISREGSFGEFVMDVSMYEKDSGEKVFGRARLDTGMTRNAVRHSHAKRLGYPIDEYTGDPCIVADGSEYRPIGQVILPFYFANFRTAKTWQVEFLVFGDESPFDLCLGRRFILLADLLKRNPEALPLEFKKLKSGEEREKRYKTHQADRESVYTREGEDRRYENRRRTKPRVKELKEWR